MKQRHKTNEKDWKTNDHDCLLDFLKGAFPNGSDESEPDITKSSLLLTFDIPEKDFELKVVFTLRFTKEKV